MGELHSQRINDIANQLLAKSKETHKPSVPKSQKNHIELLSGIVDVLVSEKRTQFRDRLAVSIELDLTCGYGVFADIDPIELKRALSNLVNNSVEAFDDSKGLVTVGVTHNESAAIIFVRDNGKGIPKHILDKLGQQRISYGKEGTDSGSGLGIYHAGKMVEAVGGNFRIDSAPGQGTTVYLELKKATPPNWFVEKLILTKKLNVVCIDDDVSIHQIWKGRLNTLNTASIDVSLINLSSGGALADWLDSNRNEIANSLFLVDYKLFGQKETGLDLIEKFNLETRSILVTSRFEEIGIQERCSRLGIKLIPKGLASLVPIELEIEKITYDACLIDNDGLVRLTWELAAKDAGASIITFDSFESFNNNAHKISVETPMSIDVNLANGIRGTDVALKLHKMGYKWIYLATGYEAGAIKDVPPCVTAVRGKDPFFTQMNSKSASEKRAAEVLL